MRAVLVLDCGNSHGEGVTWSAEHALLMWTDIEGQRLWTFNAVSGEARSTPVPGRLCCFAPRRGQPANQLVCAFADGFAFLDLGTGERSEISSFEPDLPQTRLNDGRTDCEGRFVAGGMDERDGESVSSVWRLEHDQSLTLLFGDVACANGTCFSPDGRTFYFADSPTRRIVARPYPAGSELPGEPRILTETRGIPDGSCTDAEGFVWNAVWEGYRVERWSPDGRLDRVVETPVAKPTCCAFGGESLDTLFITTSRLAESPERLASEPTAGGLYAIKPGVRGVADVPYSG